MVLNWAEERKLKLEYLCFYKLFSGIYGDINTKHYLSLNVKWQVLSAEVLRKYDLISYFNDSFWYTISRESDDKERCFHYILYSKKLPPHKAFIYSASRYVRPITVNLKETGNTGYSLVL